MTRNEDGNVGMIFAAMLIPTVMLIGGAVDYGDAINKKTVLQSAADAAALAAAKLDDDDSNAIIAMAEAVFNAKLEGTGLEGVTPNASFANNEVTVTADTKVPTAFMKMANIDQLEINAHAVATKGNDEAAADASTWGKICMLALDPESNDGIAIQGSKQVNLGSCWAYVNSEESTSVNDTGNSYTFTSGGVCTVGLTDITHNHFDPSVRSGCPTVDDPFSTVSAYPDESAWTPTVTLPTVSGACKMNSGSTTFKLRRGTYTLTGGRYCGGIEIMANATVTLTAGIYIMDKGRFEVASNANVTGNNVLLYMYDSMAEVKVWSGSNVNLKGRYTGSSYAGYLIIQHAEAADGSRSYIQGGGTVNLEGVVYLPTQTIEFGGNGNMNNTSKYFIAVAADFDFRGSGIIKLVDHQSSSSLPNLTPDMPNLDSQTTRLVE